MLLVSGFRLIPRQSQSTRQGSGFLAWLPHRHISGKIEEKKALFQWIDFVITPRKKPINNPKEAVVFVKVPGIIMKPGLINFFPGDYWIEIKTSYLLTMAGGEIYSTPTR